MAGRDLTGLQRKVVSNKGWKAMHTCYSICQVKTVWFFFFLLLLLLESPVNELSFGRSNWFDRVKEEHNACRENVALFDLSAYAKLEVQVRQLNFRTYKATVKVVRNN